MRTLVNLLFQYRGMFLFAVAAVALFVAIVYVSFTAVRRFLIDDESHSHPLVVFTATVSLILAAACVSLPPFDLYIATHVSLKQYPSAAERVKSVYQLLFLGIACWVNLVVPMTVYFHRQDASKNPSVYARVCAALKQSMTFAAVMVFTFLVGLAFRPGHTVWSTDAGTQHWAKKLFDTKHAGLSAILFIIGCLSTIGAFAWMSFTAYGLAAIPVNMLRGYRSIEDERLEVETELLKVRSFERSARAKETGRSRHDQDQTKKLNDKAAALQRHTQALQDMQDASAFGEGVSTPLTTRCRTISGGVLFLLSLLMTSALLLSANDSGLDSAGVDAAKACKADPSSIMCSLNSGYLGNLVHKKRMYNPLDDALVKMAEHFPLDLLALGGLLLYMSVASFVGLTRMGIRCLCFAVYRYRRKQTTATAMLALSTLFMFISLAIVVQLGSVAPQYTTFGPQSYTDDMAAPGTKGVVSKARCTLQEDIRGVQLVKAGMKKGQRCNMSQLALLLIEMVKMYPIFSHLFFASSWVFALVFFLTMVYRGFCTRRADNFLTSDFENDLHTPPENAKNSRGDVETGKTTKSFPSDGGFTSAYRDESTSEEESSSSDDDEEIGNEFGQNIGGWNSRKVAAPPAFGGSYDSKKKRKSSRRGRSSLSSAGDTFAKYSDSTHNAEDTGEAMWGSNYN